MAATDSPNYPLSFLFLALCRMDIIFFSREYYLLSEIVSVTVKLCLSWSSTGNTRNRGKKYA